MAPATRRGGGGGGGGGGGIERRGEGEGEGGGRLSSTSSMGASAMSASSLGASSLSASSLSASSTGASSSSAASSASTSTAAAGQTAVEAGDIVDMAVAGARSLVLLMALHRGATFVLNQLLLRFTDPAVFGAAIQLEILLGASLFVAREGMRLALLRGRAVASSDAGGRHDTVARQVNHAWLALPATVVTAAAMAALYLWDTEKLHEVPGFRTAVVLYAVAAVLESVFEPVYALTQHQFLVSVRVLVESAALVVRCIVTFHLVVYRDMGVVAFGVAQVVYSLTLIAGYFGYVAAGFARGKPALGLHHPAELLPHRLHGPPAVYWDGQVLALARTFTFQSMLKYVLSEGDRMVLAVVMPLFDQGVYALVYNYGSLVARLLFQPVEEVSRTMFAKLVDAATVDQVDSHVAPGTVVVRSLLIALVKAATVIGLVFVAFGANYTNLLIYLMLGPTWGATAAPTVLAWYCLYVLTMGINGITEAFLYATGSKRQIEHLNRYLIVFAGIFAASAAVLVTRFGTVGLVLANCINMTLRIAYSARFISQYFARKQAPLHWHEFLVKPQTLAVFVAAFAVLHSFAQGYINPFGFHPTFFDNPVHPEARASSLIFVALGVVAIAIVAAHTFMAERVLFRELQHLVQSRTRVRRAE